MRSTVVALALAALTLAAIASGCGGAKGANGSDGNGADNAAARSDAQLRFTRCLRDHGVDVREDPAHPGAIAIRGKPGDEHKFDAAQRACRKLVPGGFKEPSPEEREKMRDAALKFARCMRAHGVDVPDPSTSGGGLTIKVQGGKNRPRFEAAQKACQKLLPEPPITQAAGG